MAMRHSRLQFLWELADATLGREDTTPSPQQIETLMHAFRQVPLDELGVSPETAASTHPPAEDAASPPIVYLHIFENAHLSLGIFCLPARAQIPLHNHPGMTVLSRVLYGEMHVQSFDWRDPEGGDGTSPRPAVTVHDRTFGANDDPAVLFPSAGGNIHQFTAVTDCAVLDLLSPPYSTDDGRDCTYYRLVSRDSDGVGALLAEEEPPLDFIVHSQDYTGVHVEKHCTHSHPIVIEERSGSSVDSMGSGSPRSVTPPPSTPGTMSNGASDLAVLLKEASLGELKVRGGNEPTSSN